MAKEADGEGGGVCAGGGSAGGVPAGDGVQQRDVPEPGGVLWAWDGDLYDYGGGVHAELPVLRGVARGGGRAGGG